MGDKEIELLLLYKRLRKNIKSLYGWLDMIYKQCSRTTWLGPDDPWESIEWRKTIENEIKEAKELLTKYNILRVGKDALPPIYLSSFEINDNDSIDKVVSTIIKIARVAEDAYNALSVYIKPQLSEAEKRKIDSLRRELEEMENKGYDELLIKNLKEAVREIENNHYLASSMIAARVILYCIEQIEGKTDEDKAKELTTIGITIQGEESKETKKWFIKAVRSARNSISHKINLFPSASDAFSILGDSFKMVKILNQYKSKMSE